MSQWLEKNSTALIAIASAALGALYAAVRTIFSHLVEKQEARILELEAKLETANQRLLQTSMTLERLLGKYERERGSTSSRPPKST